MPQKNVQNLDLAFGCRSPCHTMSACACVSAIQPAARLGHHGVDVLVIPEGFGFGVNSAKSASCICVHIVLSWCTHLHFFIVNKKKKVTQRAGLSIYDPASNYSAFNPTQQNWSFSAAKGKLGPMVHMRPATFQSAPPNFNKLSCQEVLKYLHFIQRH